MKRGIALGLLSLVAGVLLVSGSVEWADVRVSSPVQLNLAATGQGLAALVSAIGVVLLGAVGALTIARGAGRQVLGALVAIASVCLASDLGARMPGWFASSRPALEAALAHGGVKITGSSVESVTVVWNAWPFVALGLALAGVGLGVAIVLSARNWPRGRRRFEREPATDASPAATWDAQTAGDDPTASVHEHSRPAD
ncbi:MAG TPA: Trp biosynthesis-associated membrane protein [Microbacteriaceae bacterium]|nr:Trp biosynthesis-associated membrane protein [Microbacteriaceae bacterium]